MGKIVRRYRWIYEYEYEHGYEVRGMNIMIEPSGCWLSKKVMRCRVNGGGVGLVLISPIRGCQVSTLNEVDYSY